MILPPIPTASDALLAVSNLEKRLYNMQSDSHYHPPWVCPGSTSKLNLPLSSSLVAMIQVAAYSTLGIIAAGVRCVYFGMGERDGKTMNGSEWIKRSQSRCSSTHRKKAICAGLS